MRHEHDWTTSSRFCHACGVDGWEVAAGPEAFICHGKPAGNTGRHETPSETGLWDRLRADLNNLGAAYGELSEAARMDTDVLHGSGPLTPFGEALQSLGNGLAGAATSQRRDSEPVEISELECVTSDTMANIISHLEAGNRQCQRCALWVTGTLMDKHHNGSCLGRQRQLLVDQCVIDKALDAILLAARKKREALAWMDEPLTDDERDICHAMWDEQDRAEKVSAAMSRPLDFEPRVGHKGVEIDG